MATVQDILARKGTDVVTVEASASVLDAARLMNERGIGGLVVTETGKPVGIFTERDILRRVVAEARDPARTIVRSVMTTPVTTVDPAMPLEQCSALVTERRIRHLPVLREGRLGGIITSGDILAFQAQEQKDTIQFLSNYVYDMR